MLRRLPSPAEMSGDDIAISARFWLQVQPYGEPSLRPLSSLRLGTLATLDLFLTLGLLGVYLKAALLDQHWDAVMRFLGKKDQADLSFFATFRVLSFRHHPEPTADSDRRHGALQPCIWPVQSRRRDGDDGDAERHLLHRAARAEPGGPVHRPRCSERSDWVGRRSAGHDLGLRRPGECRRNCRTARRDPGYRERGQTRPNGGAVISASMRRDGTDSPCGCRPS